MATFSIITVTYNSEETLARAMESVISQSMAPLEYIIIDGGSNDGTIAVAESFRGRAEKSGINLKIVSEPDNGIYDAMNKGIKLAGGQIIGIINSDDYYEKDALAKVNRIYEVEGFDLFYADVVMHLKNGKSFVKRAKNRRYSTSRDWNHPTTFITKEMYRHYQYKNETIHDDYDLILRMKKAGAKIAVLNEPIAHFTMNGVSHKRSITGAVQRIKIKYGIYRNNGYSRFYIVECVLVELGKLIFG